MPLITTRFLKMWTSFKQSVPNLGEERIYLTRCVSRCLTRPGTIALDDRLAVGLLDGSSASRW